MARVCAIVNHYIATSWANFRTEPQTPGEWGSAFDEGHERYPWLVAEVDGDVAGVAYAAAWQARAAYGWTAQTTVYVDPGCRGRGLGRALYAGLLPVLAAQGYRSAVGGIALPNDASVALHEACGFVPAGVIARAGYKLGAWHDVGYWQAQLGDGDAPPRPLRRVHEVSGGAGRGQVG